MGKKLFFSLAGDLNEAQAIQVSSKRRSQLRSRRIPANTVFQNPGEFFLCNINGNRNAALVAVARYPIANTANTYRLDLDRLN